MLSKIWIISGALALIAFGVDVGLLVSVGRHGQILTVVAFALFVVTIVLWVRFSMNNRRPSKVESKEHKIAHADKSGRPET